MTHDFYSVDCVLTKKKKANLLNFDATRVRITDGVRYIKSAKFHSDGLAVF